MTRLMRATDLVGRPVVTLDTAEDVAEIKDVVFDADGADLVGFTLRGRGLLGTPNLGYLPSSAVVAIGRDAVMITGEAAIADRDPDLARARSERRDVIGDEVLTDAGRQIGVVRDLILQVDGNRVDVVGYEVETEDASRSLVPIPETFAVSAATLVVPAAVELFISHDLTGFGGSVDRFREHLRTDRSTAGERGPDRRPDENIGDDTRRAG